MADHDLDDAALWACVDTVAQASQKERALPKPPTSCSPAISRCAPLDDPHRGEVLQPARPFKLQRIAPQGHATPPPPYMTPDASRGLMLVQHPRPELPWVTEPNAASPVAVAAAAHSLFPTAAASVASFRKYQEVSLSVRPLSSLISHPIPRYCSLPGCFIGSIHTPEFFFLDGSSTR
jgi:hypothetical protein